MFEKNKIKINDLRPLTRKFFRDFYSDRTISAQECLDAILDSYFQGQGGMSYPAAVSNNTLNPLLTYDLLCGIDKDFAKLSKRRRYKDCYDCKYFDVGIEHICKKHCKILDYNAPWYEKWCEDFEER